VAIEIERKFRVQNDQWRRAADAGTEFRQGYLGEITRVSVRVRVEGERANLNIKSAEIGSSRLEFEYPIPLADAETLLELASGPLVEKRRYLVHVEGTCFEIDEFRGDNLGLVLAEVELPHPDAPFPRPSWLGEEVTADPRFYNVYLSRHPWRSWGQEPGES
jgi:adenylate cyclase